MIILGSKNNAQTTLNGAINDTTTTVVVTDGSALPSASGSTYFVITVDNEIMLVTNKATNTLTVTRGYEGTTAASHSSGANVYNRFTSTTYQNLADAVMAVQGMPFKQYVKVATTGNITLSGEQTIDGVAVYASDYVLVKNQSTSTQNGIYQVSTSTWTLLSTATNDMYTTKGYIAVMIESGTANANTIWTNHGSTYTWNQLGRIASGLTAGHFLKATGANTFNFGAHGLTNTDVGAAATIHNLIDTTNHPVTGLTAGHFLKATSATAYEFGAHGLDAAAVGAVSSTLTTGSFTPTLYGTTTAGTPSYDGQVGTYVRMGRLVYFTFYILLNSLSGAAGTWRIGGLPVAVNSISGIQHWTLQGDPTFNLKPVRPISGQTYLDIKQDNIRSGNMAVSTISGYLGLYCTGFYWSA